MVELTVRVGGAIMHAPRELRAWIAAAETCVRDDTGTLLWLSTDDQSAWVEDGVLTTVPTRPIGDASETALLREPTPEVVALRNIPSAIAWLNADSQSLIQTAKTSKMIGREVDWFQIQHLRLANLQLARDRQTGIILQISSASTEHGDMLVEVTTMAVIRRAGTNFRPRMQL